MKIKKLLALLGMLCLVGALVLTFAMAQARFRENITETLPFQPHMSEDFILQQGVTWEISGDKRTMSFSLKNTASYPQQGQIYLLASEGIQSGDTLGVVLVHQGIRYTATPQPIPEGSALHKNFGNGWIYRFLDGNGTDIPWTVEAGGQQSYEITVQSRNQIEQHSLIRLVATKTENS